MKNLSRRKFFASTGAAALSIGAASTASKTTAATIDGPVRYDRSASTMPFEITRTDAEWREMLTDYEYYILREGLTEGKKSNPLWQENAKGTYHCRGCELPVYTSNQKVIHDIGYVFFYHSEPDSVLTAIEGNVPAVYDEEGANLAGKIEVHCRRCSSHLGHVVIIKDTINHCINGTALIFEPSAAA